MDPFPPRVTRAAVWVGSGIEIRQVDVPDLSPGDTLVRVRLATVCGSDLHTVSGRRSAPCPSVLGHEAVGEVVSVGGPALGDRDDLRVGDRVIWSVTVGCGQCDRCRSGRTAKCHTVRKFGHQSFDGGWALSGAYAEHIVLPRGTAVVRIPASMPDAVAAPAACATATVMATLEAAGDVAGRRVLICGAGMLGLTAAAACAAAGARVRVSDIEPSRLALVDSFGGTPDGGGPVDAAIDFSGSSDAIGGALARLDIGGVLVLAGSVLPVPPVSVDPEAVVRRWLTITGVHNYEPRHLARAVEFLGGTGDIYPWAGLVAEPVRLDDLAGGLKPAPPGMLRAAVAP